MIVGDVHYFTFKVVPKRSLFTTVPGRLAQLARPRRADLHVHTNASDGEYSPTQVVALARQASLAAVAVTDHDTLAAADAARVAASDHIEVVPGVEISAGYNGREVHLLGYFVRTDHPELNAALSRLCERRRDRFHDFVAKLAANSARLPDDRVRLVADSSPSLGQRHVASLLVACGFAKTRHEAFGRHIGPLTGKVLRKELLPVEDAIRLVRDAGGVASLAHPSPELTDDDYRVLAKLELAALEVEYPWSRRSAATRLRETASRLGFAVTGGSDCHGPEPSHRRIGAHGITSEELEQLRELRDRSGSSASRG